VRLFKKARASIVRWSPGSVVVVADDVEWRASAVLVALPLPVLKAGAEGDGVSLSPEPKEVRRGLDALEMGDALRVVFRVRELPGAWSTLRPGSFVHGVDGEFPTFWLGPNAHETQITAWCGGPRATRLGALEPHSIVREATRSLAVAFDLPLEATTDLLLGAHVHAFGEDPFSRGAYPYALVGKDARGAFDPVEGTLFFAGDYTVPEELGTVGVAVRSGASAAREIQGALGSPSKRR
jgi:monoamine oxidase